MSLALMPFTGYTYHPLVDDLRLSALPVCEQLNLFSRTISLQ
jgi:hypothetical protein